MKEELTLNRKEQTRLLVLNEVERKKLKLSEAAYLLKISERQGWRLLAAYRHEGAAGLAHGNRGRKPINTLSGDTREKVLSLARAKYAGFNHCHLTEKLSECEKVLISRSAVRRILMSEGLRSPRKRRSAKHRSRRPRYPQEGMLLQIDGSPHDWLEERGPKLCLIGAIDDATGKLVHALFQSTETTAGYMQMLRQIVLQKGIPLALYHDRHGIFQVNQYQHPTLEEQLAGVIPQTQFGRLLDELGIASISANSPQAKGRIERLWGTLQDRLTSELRLAGATTMAEANAVLACFIPVFNRKFAQSSVVSGTAYRKPIQGFKAEEYFCFKYTRVVGGDNVVSFAQRRFQVLPSSARYSYAHCKVEVQERLDGEVAIYYQRKRLAVQPAPLEATSARKVSLKPLAAARPTTIAPYKPAPDHPWRKFQIAIRV